jgi:NADH-quinone oxidoreductase subunit N
MNEVQLPPIDYGALSPMLILFGAACLAVLAEAFVPKARRQVAQVLLSLAAGSGADRRDPAGR